MITCPTCHQEADPHAVQGLFVLCGACGDTLIYDADTLRKATGADVDRLTPSVLKLLRSQLMAFRAAKRANG